MRVCVCSWVFVHEKAYQVRDTAVESSVMTKVKGFGIYNNRVMDVADYVTPTQVDPHPCTPPPSPGRPTPRYTLTPTRYTLTRYTPTRAHWGKLSRQRRNKKSVEGRLGSGPGRNRPTEEK